MQRDDSVSANYLVCLATLDSSIENAKIRFMSKRTKFLETIIYVLTCAFFAGLIMFVCMAAGEVSVDPQLFRGFLLKPKIWPLIFLESATWMIPMTLLSLPLLWILRQQKESVTTAIVVGGWAVLGIAAIVAYKIIYDPHDWALHQVTRADVTFGWTIPCMVILITNSVLSLQYLNCVRR